jgi:Zn-dependent peptidase ImmA (M78 family)
MKDNFSEWKNNLIQAVDTVKPIPERIRQSRLFRGFSVNEFAEKIGVSRQALHAFERGNKSPSATTLGKIVNITNMPLSFFSKTLSNTSDVSLNFRSLATSKVMSKEIVGVFSELVEEIFIYLKGYIDFPDVNLPEIKDITPGYIDTEKIEDIACNLRTYWQLGFGPLSNIVRLLERNGVVIASMLFGDPKIDACSYWSDFNRPILLLSSDKNCAVRNRFNIIHELAHLILHKNLTQQQKDDKEFMKRIEKEAHRFAGAFLLPYKSFPNEILSTSLEHFISLKERWRVSISAMIYRCQDLGILNENQVLHLRKNMASKKMLTKEPLDDTLPIESPAVFKQSFELLMEHKILSSQCILNDLCMFSDDVENIAGLPNGSLTYNSKVVPLLRLKK